MTLSRDILAELAEIAIGSPLDQARAICDAATRHAQEVMKCCSASRILTFLLMNASPWPRRWRNYQADALARATTLCGFGLRPDHGPSGSGAGLCPPADLHSCRSDPRRAARS